jgi:hypothetical protein
MKFLRNPIVVGVLAIIACAYSVWTALGSRRPRFSQGSDTPAAATPSPDTAPLPSSTPAAPELASNTSPVSDLSPDRLIDIPTVASLAARWIESPRRDPFRVERPRESRPSGPPASQLLSLRAVWRQTGSQLAVINEQILREGDQLQGFAIETIEAEGVWVRGTNGRERITFPASIAMLPLEQVTTALDGPAPRQDTITAKIPIDPAP